MTLLIHITDTHIVAPGEVLYGDIDTGLHLREAVRNINAMRPAPAGVMFTGDLVETGDEESYAYFLELIKPLKMPAWVIPGNHDNPKIMLEVFAGTGCFPATQDGFQYAIDDLPFRILALNSHCSDTELPGFDEQRLSWLEDQLSNSDKPVLIAIHHPPMKTGIELVEMGGSDWYQGLKQLLAEYPQVKLVICGHCHTDLSGRIGQVPVYMAPANSHLLIATRGLNIAPATLNRAGPPTLHHFIDGDFLSGSHPWPDNVDDQRIDRKSGLSWEQMKKVMMGSRTD